MSLTKKLTGKTNAATSRKLTQPPAGVSGSTPDPPTEDWLLLENGDAILLENEDELLLESA